MKCGISLKEAIGEKLVGLATPTAQTRRPIGVWLISVFLVVSIGWTILSLALIHAGIVPLSAEQKTYFENLSVIDYLSSVGLGLLNLAGVVLLFLLRRRAVFFFGMTFVLNVAFVLIQILSTNWLRAIGVPGFLGAFFGWSIQGAIILYARNLRNKGVLK